MRGHGRMGNELHGGRPAIIFPAECMCKPSQLCFGAFSKLMLCAWVQDMCTSISFQKAATSSPDDLTVILRRLQENVGWEKVRAARACMAVLAINLLC